MASSPEFARYVCDQIAGIGAVRCRKTFGEYIVYVDDRPTLWVMDDTVYLKKLPCLAEMGLETAHPMPDWPEYYLLDIDNGELSRAAARKAADVTPLPKKKRK